MGESIRIPSVEKERVAVLGLARSGLAAAAALATSGAEVWAWDDDAAKRERAASKGIICRDLAEADLSGFLGLVISPGIPHTHPKPHPVAVRAKAAGVPLLSDVELLGRACPQARFIGITGTNGKSTTTTLIGHLLKETGRPIQVGGNLGVPALSLAPLGKGGIYVLEMSSYQLELIPRLVFDVSVLLNIAPDHLDRHGGMPGYIAAKRRIFERQDSEDTAVVAIDDPESEAIYDDLVANGRQHVMPVSATRMVMGGVFVEDGLLTDDTGGWGTPVLDLRLAPTLPGRHNWQNAAAAYAVASQFEIGHRAIARSFITYPGLAHRQERVATIDGVTYVNDSKATNADAASKALACYDAIYWIAGGRAKEGGIESLIPLFPNVRHAFLIGEATDSFARTLDGRVPYTRSGDLSSAVAAAAAKARADKSANAIVLLSPACASFDQFADFEARGETFRGLVDALPGDRA
ncbi:MAG: UDP-N-acetylmuramoyl-L-alanine--D-glutamate ligase [Alphaproteobacteria bacterium]|nr:UDP-N-acetylmuramoyl-L-alanine--D-glutamate ligase [Alphaproteobacteria bacterium]